MSSATTSRIRAVLAPYADELEAAAAEADDPAEADVYAGLAALARGEDIPQDVAQRVLDRAEEWR